MLSIGTVAGIKIYNQGSFGSLLLTKEFIMKDMFALIACVCGLVATLLGFAMNPLAYVFVGVALVHLGIWFYLTWCE